MDEVVAIEKAAGYKLYHRGIETLFRLGKLGLSNSINSANNIMNVRFSYPDIISLLRHYNIKVVE